MASRARPRKVVDETAAVRCAVGSGLIREEVWQDEAGELVRYNLAFICHQLCSSDKGRVLGYDNQHGHHHRHFLGSQASCEYAGYDKLLARFIDEVEVLRKQSHEDHSSLRRL